MTRPELPRLRTRDAAGAYPVAAMMCVWPVRYVEEDVMAKKDDTDIVEETATEEKLVRRGEAVPVDPSTGGPALDALQAVRISGS